jgi:hypothetical protein
MANRPDIIMKNKKEKTCLLIDVVIPADRNVTQKKAEKKLKYRSVQLRWNMKFMIILVITEAIRRVTKGLKKTLEAIPGKHLIDSLQKTGTLPIIWKVLQYEI